jgi:hypothetical protein
VATHPNRPIRNGTAFRDGKMYAFSRRGILVASQWPDMRAWRKTPKGRQWQHVRPEMSLEKTKDGWSCVWGHREPRQHTHIDGCHPASRFERDSYDQEALADGKSFEEFFLGRPCPLEYDLNDEVGSEEWWKWVRWDYARQQNERVQAEYLSPVPDGILAAISRFPNRHWHLLNLVARCPRALDLVRATPALALALSSPWVFRRTPPSHPLRSARSLLGRHQTDIAAWLGFPDAWSTVKILRKLPPGECTVLNLLHLRDLFRTHLKTLQHLPCLNGSVIRLMSGETDRYRACPGFLQKIASQPGLLDQTVRILRYTLWLREKLEDPKIITLRSYKHLTRAHDRFVDQLGHSDLRIIDPPPYPPPPLIPASSHLEMEPLQTETDLLEEGRAQKNCVGAYGPRVRYGKIYLYRLLKPERATVAVSLDNSGRWQLHEIESCQNSEVLPATLTAVLEWIACAGSITAEPLERDPVCPQSSSSLEIPS